MTAAFLLVAAIWPATVTQFCQPNEDTKMIGVAESSKGDFIYCEMVSNPQSTHYHIDYTKNSTIFAVKELNYNSSPNTPDVHQEDLRSGEVRSTSVTSDSVTLNYQANRSKKNKSVNLDRKSVDIIDAGFDNFIRENWDKILQEKFVSVDFASMAHQKTLPLRISAQPLSKCSNPVNDPKTQCFLVEIDSAFLRMLIGNIKLIYDEKRRLLQFDGMVNIEDDKESTQNAVIRYFYRQDF